MKHCPNFEYFHFIFYYFNSEMKENTNHNSRSLKWESNGELPKDLTELIERLKNVESEDTSSELSRLGAKSNIKN